MTTNGGACETWLKTRTLLIATRIDKSYWFSIVIMKALKGEANEFFWQEYLASNGTATVDDIMIKLIEMFDRPTRGLPQGSCLDQPGRR